ncbi:hypothetical protein GDO81_005101 [Engystomops pustulosus]|uniref:Secreted protein n=1 Tax=Engystomops pustulosus TaxID=76066 RepID=A0AAV7CKU4_ENGPU|nr:hypothetical protein GDO81_005101 [Engystomops pustulosus]
MHSGSYPVSLIIWLTLLKIHSGQLHEKDTKPYGHSLCSQIFQNIIISYSQQHNCSVIYCGSHGHYIVSSITNWEISIHIYMISTAPYISWMFTSCKL